MAGTSEDDFPFGVPNEKLFQKTKVLKTYLPCLQMFDFSKKKVAHVQLPEISQHFKNYLANDQKLNENNYCEVLKILLELEDVGYMKTYMGLIKHGVTLNKNNNVYSMKVSRFPYQLRAFDEVLIIPEYLITPETPKTELMLKSSLKEVHFGYVDSIIPRPWRIQFSCRTGDLEKKPHTIVFRPSRTLLRYQFCALEFLQNNSSIKQLLFPKPTLSLIKSPKVNASSFKFFNTQISRNPEQLEAVLNIIGGCAQKAPYIIIGPPGTGKTTTLAETILQIYKQDPTSKILITAISNSSCDEIALRLLKVLSSLETKRVIARIYSYFYEERWPFIPEELLSYSNLWTDHYYPDIDILHEYRIVICTLSVVAKLATGNFGFHNIDGSNVYTHIFVDDAASCTEAETLMAIANTCSINSNLILAGDPKQLGPIVHSERAKEFGLEKSLMERLLSNTDVYGDKNVYNHYLQTRLCRNYRSHPEIVNLYNHLYYDGKLIAMATDESAKICKNWPNSLNPDYPIIFQDVTNGVCLKDPVSFSFLNCKEAEIVMAYIETFLNYKSRNLYKITKNDIGVITPYKAQTLLMEQLLYKKKLHEIEVGTVESFQGKEKKIIIATLVRAKGNLGFIDEPRRINVLISRAKSMLIIVGHSQTLCKKLNGFQHIINECKSHNTFATTLDHLKRIAFMKTDTYTQDSIVTAMKNMSIDNKNKRSKNLRKRRARKNKKTKTVPTTTTTKTTPTPGTTKIITTTTKTNQKETK